MISKTARARNLRPTVEDPEGASAQPIQVEPASREVVHFQRHARSQELAPTLSAILTVVGFKPHRRFLT